MRPVFIVFKVFGCEPLAVFENREDAVAQIVVFKNARGGENFVIRESTLIWDQRLDYFKNPMEAKSAVS